MWSMGPSRLLCAAIAASVPSAAALGCSQDATSRLLVVSTPSGVVKGHTAPNTTCVLEYLGIPYAKPPVGDLRFAAPQPLDRQKPYDADNFGFDCPLTPSKPVNFPGFTPQAQRIISYFASGAGNPQSEDCLTLNIWSKATPRTLAAKKPVLVFFYGGRFTAGNTNTPFLNGKHLADAQDLVVVTVNYRTNIFGFPGAFGEPLNLGLLDQRAAVTWMRANIAAFGGDPNRTVLAGQSAGGVSADYWAYSHTDNPDPIVTGLILVSGTALSFPIATPDTARRNWDAVVAAVGCNTTSATDKPTIMACMRTVDWTALKSAAASIPPAKSSSPLRSIPPFYPQPDNKTVFSDYPARTKAGLFAKIPVLASVNDNEAGWYRISAYGNGIIPTDEQVTSFQLESFTCPVSYQAAARRVHGVSVWVYRYFADWENTRLYNGSGAYHGVDLHMVFGGSEEVSGLPATGEQRRLTALVQRAWAAFVEDPVRGLERELGWPRWERGKESFVLLGVNNTAGAGFVEREVYDVPCSAVTMGALGTPEASSVGRASLGPPTEAH